MITLNLLPPELRKKRKSLIDLKASFVMRLPLFKICLSVAGGLLLLQSILFLILCVWSFSLRGLKMKWEVIAEKRRMVAEVMERYEDLSAKEKTLQQLTGQRSLWARKLKGLSDSMTPGVWLRALLLEERNLPPPANAPKGARGSVKKMLILEGTAASLRGDEPAIIGRFIRSLKENPNFFSEFQEAELESMRRRDIEETEVMDFRILCTFREAVPR